jgi:hypothetical protein
MNSKFYGDRKKTTRQIHATALYMQHFATFGNFTTDFAPTAMGFFAHFRHVFSGDSLGMVDGQFTTSTSCFLQV